MAGSIRPAFVSDFIFSRFRGSAGGRFRGVSDRDREWPVPSHAIPGRRLSIECRNNQKSWGGLGSGTRRLRPEKGTTLLQEPRPRALLPIPVKRHPASFDSPGRVALWIENANCRDTTPTGKRDSPRKARFPRERDAGSDWVSIPGECGAFRQNLWQPPRGLLGELTDRRSGRADHGAHWPSRAAAGVGTGGRRWPVRLGTEPGVRSAAARFRGDAVPRSPVSYRGGGGGFPRRLNPPQKPWSRPG